MNVLSETHAASCAMKIDSRGENDATAPGVCNVDGDNNRDAVCRGNRILPAISNSALEGMPAAVPLLPDPGAIECRGATED
jgi:hypothetical protein